MWATVLLALLGSSTVAKAGEVSVPVHPPRRFDVSVALFLAWPERFVGCGSMHFVDAVEVDACAAGDQGTFTFSSHVFYRKRWLFFPSVNGLPGLQLGLGPGLGARVTAFCAHGICLPSGGPEALLSVELVKWLRPGLGLTLQVDGGLAVVWLADTTGIVDRGYRFPVRALMGVAF